jgi:ABC-type polysaccharide/polyol phosphate transport system ATPase subunit
MIVPLILDPLLKLIDKGVEFLREGEHQKKLFFEEVIQPLEEAFEELYAAHIATLKQTRKMLLSSKSANEIASFVEGRILFEQGTTNSSCG